MHTAWDADLMEDIVVHRNLEAPAGERSADKRYSCKVQLQELGGGEERAGTNRPEENWKHLVVVVEQDVARSPPIDFVEEAIPTLLFQTTGV